MDKVVPFLNSKSIHQEACAWLAKLDGETFGPNDREALNKWMGQSPKHLAELQNLARLWGQLNVLTELAVEPPSHAERPASDTSRGGWRFPVLPAMAASLSFVAVCVVVLGLVFRSALWSGHELPVSQNGDYVTMVGEQQTLSLNDGSTLLLNTDTRVKVEYREHERRVYLLQGEAHFDVAHWPERPFHVYAGSRFVRAVGTAFSVYLKPSGMDVTVTEGRVALRPLGKVSPPAKDLGGNSDAYAPRGRHDGRPYGAPDVELAGETYADAGQRIRVDGDRARVENVEQEQLEKSLAWHNGLLRFTGDPLEQVIDEVGRYTQQQVVILDPEIRELRIGGIFKVGETDRLFEALEASFGVQVVRINDNLAHLSAPSR